MSAKSTKIRIANFSKSFGKKRVIEDLNFEVKEQEVFAFLGANGSGKTTTIRSLLGIYEPDEGELTIDGKRYTHEMSRELGYLPEERGLYLDSKVLETMIYFGQLKGMDAASARKRAEEYLERVGLADKATQKIKNLSSGQQQKIQLGITILNNPSLLILDEPTKGLDPVNRNLLMEMLDEYNKEFGTTIIFSTHQMEEAEKVANRLVMIKNGKRRLYGAVNEVKTEFGGNNVKVEFTGHLKPNEKMFKILNAQQNFAELEVGNKADINAIITYLMVEQGLKLQSFEHTLPSLQQIFVSVSQADE